MHATDDGLLTEEEVALILKTLPTLPAHDKEALLADLEELENKRAVHKARNDFMAFCHFVYPGFKEGAHHRHMQSLLHGVKDGTEKRLTISMPPRHGKSETVAYLFVAWFFGHFPREPVMMITHTADLSADFGRRVRNLIETPVYQKVFPGTRVARDKSSASNWATTVGGKYLAIGIGANVAGHGATLIVADDLVSEQAVLAGDPDKAFAEAWEYVQVGPLQRLHPGGRVVMIGCMTAETGVLMADGTQKEIQHIKVGDEVATYDAGDITTSRITNWIEHPSDFVYKIITTSGTIVRANKRHPFLVDRNGVRSWVRVRDLKVGDCLVKVVQPQDANDRDTLKECAAPATNDRHGRKEKVDLRPKQKRGQKQRRMQVGYILQDGRVGGKAWSVPSKAAVTPSLQKDYVTVVTEKTPGVRASTDLLSSKNAKAISSIGMAFRRKITTLCLRVKRVVAQFVSALQLKKTQGPDKRQNCTLTTAMTQRKSEDSCAITATWPLDTQTQKKCYSKLRDTYDTIPDAIVEIIEDGFEPVFDMEVERTENFIANGVVSHNTRWGVKDPIGRALAWADNNPDSPPWHEVRFPALLPSGKALWPEQWSAEELLTKKASMFPQFWAAQYMQEPSSEEGALVKREWWKVWPHGKPPECEYILQSWDTAHETKTASDPSGVQTWGIFYNEEAKQDHIILLDAWTGRKEFPDLKKFCLEYYAEWEPDSVIVEKKAAGAPLIQELRRVGVPVAEFTPSRGQDKRVRLNSVTDFFHSGMVWCPDTRWAKEVQDEVAAFPNAEHDEMVDCLSQALIKFRQGGFIRMKTDAGYSEDQKFRPRRAKYY